MKGLVCALALVVLFSACRREQLSAKDCQLILDGITDLELAERGFRDPALAARRRADLRARLAPDLALCTGRRVRRGALDCVRQAPSAEDISHRCLR